MKTRYIKSIMIMLMVWMVLPIAANDYLKIYFKDGHTERHYMKLVENITVTKYDLEGNLHNDYQMQQIVMADTTYSYYLTDIDSMSFKKVYEEQLKSDIENVTAGAENALQSCLTVEDMEQHLEELRSLEGVESVSMIPSGVVIQVRNWRKIFYIIPPEPEEDEELQYSMKRILQMDNIVNTSHNRAASNSDIKVALANKLHNSIRWKGQQEAMNTLNLELKALGIDSRYIGNVPLSFFTENMDEYDHIILLTHGIFVNGVHFLATDDRVGKDKLEQFLSEQVNAGIINQDDIDDFSYTKSEESGFTYYLTVSENFLKKCPSKRKHNSPSIFYNGACETLMGNQIIERMVEPYTIRGNDNMAKAFLEKENGFDIYLGYNYKNRRGIYGAVNLFENMLNGQSEEVAFCNVKPKNLFDSFTNAYLADVYKNNDSKYRKMFLVKTNTKEISPLDLVDYNVNGEIRLTGSTTMLSPEESTVKCGFMYSIDGIDYPNILCEKEFNKGETKEDNVHFSTTIDPQNGKNLVYRAFTYDGIYYNWGEEKSFTVPTADQLCPAKIAHVVLDSAIYKRNDEYPNNVCYTVSSTLDDLSGIEEWGIYYEDNSGKREFAYSTVAHEQSIGMRYHKSEGWSCVDIESFVMQVNDEVGPYVKKRDPSTGNLVTYYGPKFSYTLRYDQKPSLTMFDPVITGTKIIETNNGDNKYETTISYKRTFEGGFWVDYIETKISGDGWNFTNTPSLWYPVYDGTYERTWSSTYWDSSTSLGHTNWFVLHLRNSQVINSNYLNWSGDDLITNVWVSSSPSYSRKKSPANDSESSANKTSEKMNTVEMDLPTASDKQATPANKEKIVVPYKDGLLGAY